MRQTSAPTAPLCEGLLPAGNLLPACRRFKMKFVFTYTTQQGGSEADRHEAAKKAQQLLATWQPSDTASILQWVSRVDGNGGFSVIETDNAENILKDLSTWSSFLDFQVYPVVDIADATPVTQAALDARSALDS
jgi:hypothetical protein